MKINMKITAMQRFSKKNKHSSTNSAPFTLARLHHHGLVLLEQFSTAIKAHTMERNTKNETHASESRPSARCMVRYVMLQRSCHTVNHSLDSTPSCTHAVRATVCCKPHPICTTRLPLRPVTNCIKQHGDGGQTANISNNTIITRGEHEHRNSGQVRRCSDYGGRCNATAGTGRQPRYNIVGRPRPE